jgi:hypothetical protein
LKNFSTYAICVAKNGNTKTTQEDEGEENQIERKEQVVGQIRMRYS